MDVLSQDRRRFITEIQNIIAIRLREEDFERAAENMSYLRLLGSTSVPSQEQRALVDDKLVQEIRENLSRNTSGGDNAAAERIAFLRLLRAYEVKFIPDKGIEIIDEAPAEFEQNKPQLPEVRRF